MVRLCLFPPTVARIKSTHAPTRSSPTIRCQGFDGVDRGNFILTLLRGVGPLLPFHYGSKVFAGTSFVLAAHSFPACRISGGGVRRCTNRGIFSQYALVAT